MYIHFEFHLKLTYNAKIIRKNHMAMAKGTKEGLLFLAITLV